MEFRLPQRLGNGLAALFVILALAVAVAALPAMANDQRHHALSLVGEPKFATGFKHFDWVNPTAPKTGTVRMSAIGTFDTLNLYNIKGSKAAGLGLTNDTLMMGSPDESSTEYGLVAEWVSYPHDFSSATFGLRPGARFHDGKSITPEDVIFTLEALKTTHPQYGYYYKNVVKAEKTGEREVTFRFDQTGNRELPLIVGQLPVLPKHYWEGKGENGELRDLAQTTLEIPLGSGPYRIKSFEPGRNIVYERVKDWWAKDLPVALGQWNFDEVRFEYFRDRVPAFEAFKAGGIDFFAENSAKEWATAYAFEALNTGHVKKEEIKDGDPPQMQAFAFNLRRPQFKDPRVRRAFILAFDFEWANKNIFFDQYARVTNYFGEEDLRSRGLPEGLELQLLEEVRADVPPEVFTTPYTLPVNKTPEDVRRHLAQAAKLLAEAGWTPKNGVLTNTKGEQLTAEFLNVQPDFERIIQPYARTLERLGVKASIRTVDPAQYERRNDDFDFDIVIHTFAQSSSPGNEQRNYWGSAAADTKGSQNLLGVKNAAIDRLIDRIIFAKDRAELAAATRALDRVLLWNHYVVPQWYSPNDRIAYWAKFARPAKLPSRNFAFLQVWWYDEAAAKKLAEVRGR
jgi:microcin C transport system substrate-binding protein